MIFLSFLILPILLFSKPFKVATYNVENLFDDVFQGSEYREYMPKKNNWNANMVEVKLNHTAEVICDIDADVLGLQEVENAHILKQLVKKLKQVGCPYAYSAITHKSGASIQVALLSRYPIKQEHDIQVGYSKNTRNILEVEIEIRGKSLTVFVNHWKSKSYGGSESKRIRYAKALQRGISKLSTNKEYIILGDFNEDYNAYMTLEKKNNDTHGRTAFNDVLKTKVGKHLVDKNMIQKAKRGVHYSLWLELPAKQRWSHKYYAKRSSLDQIVLPYNMFDGKGIDYVDNSFRVYKADYLFTKKGYINRWQLKKGKHLAKGYSDHLPIFAYFDTKPYYKEGHSKIAKNIEYLYDVEYINRAIKLQNVVVLLKRGRNAVVKQTPLGRGIVLYGCVDKLIEGHSYDILVKSLKSYHGLKEINKIEILKDKGVTDKIDSFYAKNSDLYADTLRQNEAIHNIKGVYKDRYFIFKCIKIHIYFKKKSLVPKNGSILNISYAHLGYYNGLELIIYSKKDFKVMEN